MSFPFATERRAVFPTPLRTCGRRPPRTPLTTVCPFHPLQWPPVPLLFWDRVRGCACEVVYIAVQVRPGITNRDDGSPRMRSDFIAREASARLPLLSINTGSGKWYPTTGSSPSTCVWGHGARGGWVRGGRDVVRPLLDQSAKESYEWMLSLLDAAAAKTQCPLLSTAGARQRRSRAATAAMSSFLSNSWRWRRGVHAVGLGGRVECEPHTRWRIPSAVLDGVRPMSPPHGVNLCH